MCLAEKSSNKKHSSDKLKCTGISRAFLGFKLGGGMNVKVHLFKFLITDFEEVYAVVDTENKRLHISPLNYSFNITLSLNGNLHEQLDQNTLLGEMSFNANVRKVAKEIIEELQL